jgi:perosamine synthetase
MIPYGRQYIDKSDIESVVEVLQSDWLTTGPKVKEFEESVAEYVGVKYAVAVSSGTAALHSAMYALDIGSNDEVIVPSLTFAATANCVIFQGGTPVFVDVDPDALLIDPAEVEKKVTDRTKAIIAVDYAGQPCDYDRLQEIAERRDLAIVTDGCHALGAEYNGRKVGGIADLTAFSFHPVKHITTGEGGVITTDNPEYEKRLRIFRNHGMTSDFRQREEQGTWYYEIVDLGYNYRITDFQCALGLSQLLKLPSFLKRRREISEQYREAFSDIKEIHPLGIKLNVNHAYHLYVIRVDFESLGCERVDLFQRLREEGVGVNVHYIPLHLHSFYQKRFGVVRGLCPVAEEAYESIMSLPIYPGMNDDDTNEVINVLLDVLEENRCS